MNRSLATVVVALTLVGLSSARALGQSRNEPRFIAVGAAGVSERSIDGSVISVWSTRPAQIIDVIDRRIFVVEHDVDAEVHRVREVSAGADVELVALPATIVCGADTAMVSPNMSSAISLSADHRFLCAELSDVWYDPGRLLGLVVALGSPGGATTTVYLRDFDAREPCHPPMLVPIAPPAMSCDREQADSVRRRRARMFGFECVEESRSPSGAYALYTCLDEAREPALPHSIVRRVGSRDTWFLFSSHARFDRFPPRVRLAERPPTFDRTAPTGEVHPTHAIEWVGPETLLVGGLLMGFDTQTLVVLGDDAAPAP